jgi:GNAT superfamily N-acetyltransferase
MDAVYLCRSGVIPKARGKGLQRKLISVRLRFARARCMTWAISDTFHNPASANNLIRCGFSMYEPSQPWGAKGTLYWRRRLNLNTD